MVCEDISGSLPYHLPIFQRINPKDMVEANQEEEESSTKETPNPGNLEEYTFKGRRVDSSLYYLLPAMPLL